MAREDVEAKGRRYLAEGRLVVTLAGGAMIEARCRGTGAVHRLGFDMGWWCTCPARGRCSHLVALQLVTDEAGAVTDPSSYESALGLDGVEAEGRRAA